MGQFVVIGLGTFGFNIATALSELGHEVLAVDFDAKKIEQIKDKVTHIVVADVRDKKALSEFISDDIDVAIVSLGDRMEASILATLYLKDLGVRKIIAKAVNECHGQILTSIGAAEIIYPEKDVAVSLAKSLTIPNLIDRIPLAPEYCIVEIAIPDHFIGKTLEELRLRSRYNVEVIAIKDVLSDTFHLIPRVDFKIKPDSALIIIGRESDVNKLKV